MWWLQWDFHAGSDAEILPAWVKYWSGGFHEQFVDNMGQAEDDFFILSRNAWAGTWSNGEDNVDFCAQ